jgi:hypothetical protein
MVIVEDCMSDVPNMGHLADSIYQEARQRGIRFVSSKDLQMN